MTHLLVQGCFKDVSVHQDFVNKSLLRCLCATSHLL